MLRTALFLCFTFNCLTMHHAQPAFLTPSEKDPNRSATYAELISYYQELDKQFSDLHLWEFGQTDIGLPLHAMMVSKERSLDPAKHRQHGKLIFFLNNGIHPGEPEGMDATMRFVRSLLTEGECQAWLDRITFIIIPVYNVDGCLNRGSFSRANQDGPKEYGFRGNARNLDLNRDFIKCDSRNARSFNQLFAAWRPHVFLDTHTSNGADYQHTMTLIATVKEKLHPRVGLFMDSVYTPALYQGMKEKGWDMIPYVNTEGPPDGGIPTFPDLPRFSTGYGALHQAIGYMPETHMLKPFPERLRSTLDFLFVAARAAYRYAGEIIENRNAADAILCIQDSTAIGWKLNKRKWKPLRFKGYEAGQKPSEISGMPRLYYDRGKPYEKDIHWYNSFEVSAAVSRPRAYLIPQAWQEVIERLQWNGVRMSRLTADTTVPVDMYRIKKFGSVSTPYEGHYLHNNVELDVEHKTWLFRKGDYVVYCDQAANPYIQHVLEPQAPDSFFAWNFFDSMLQQKEHYSNYVFEDLAAEFLKQHPALRAELEEKKKQDPTFAASASAQLDFVYRNSPWYEPTHNLYPVARLLLDIKLPMTD